LHEVWGFEKAAAVPLGVSLCPERDTIGGMTQPATITTPDGRSLDVWFAVTVACRSSMPSRRSSTS
jgi:hypothetical protein